MLSKWYLHWWGRPDAKIGKKQRRKDGEDDEDEDEDNKENQASGSATGTNTVQLDGIAIPSSKHPHQEDAKLLTAAKKAKKARTLAKNPMSLDMSYPFHF